MGVQREGRQEDGPALNGLTWGIGLDTFGSLGRLCMGVGPLDFEKDHFGARDEVLQRPIEARDQWIVSDGEMKARRLGRDLVGCTTR